MAPSSLTKGKAFHSGTSSSQHCLGGLRGTSVGTCLGGLEVLLDNGTVYGEARRWKWGLLTGRWNADLAEP